MLLNCLANNNESIRRINKNTIQVFGAGQERYSRYLLLVGVWWTALWYGRGQHHRRTAVSPDYHARGRAMPESNTEISVSTT